MRWAADWAEGASDPSREVALVNSQRSDQGPRVPALPSSADAAIAMHQMTRPAITGDLQSPLGTATGRPKNPSDGQKVGARLRRDDFADQTAKDQPICPAFRDIAADRLAFTLYPGGRRIEGEIDRKAVRSRSRRTPPEDGRKEWKEKLAKPSTLPRHRRLAPGYPAPDIETENSQGARVGPARGARMATRDRTHAHLLALPQ
jgi:hypothetical protein